MWSSLPQSSTPVSSEVPLWSSWTLFICFLCRGQSNLQKQKEIMVAPLLSSVLGAKAQSLKVAQPHNSQVLPPAAFSHLPNLAGSLLPAPGPLWEPFPLPERHPPPPRPTQVLPPGPFHLRTQVGLQSRFPPGCFFMGHSSSPLCPLCLGHAFRSQLKCHLLRPWSKPHGPLWHSSTLVYRHVWAPLPTRKSAL